jgi:hypothetical protein
VVGNIVARPRGGRRLGGGANWQRFSVVTVYSTPRCGGMTRDDDRRWGKHCIAYATILYANNGGGDHSVVGSSRGARELRRHFSVVEVSGRNSNRLKIGYSYSVYRRMRHRTARLWLTEAADSCACGEMERRHRACTLCSGERME